MTRDKFIDKWSNHLVGKFTLFAFNTRGPGLELRLRDMVADVERAVGLMWADAQAPADDRNGTLPLAKKGAG